MVCLPCFISFVFVLGYSCLYCPWSLRPTILASWMQELFLLLSSFCFAICHSSSLHPFSSRFPSTGICWLSVLHNSVSYRISSPIVSSLSPFVCHLFVSPFKVACLFALSAPIHTLSFSLFSPGICCLSRSLLLCLCVYCLFPVLSPPQSSPSFEPEHPFTPWSFVILSLWLRNSPFPPLGQP